MYLTLNERFDAEIIFFMLYLITIIGFLANYLKKIIVHTISIVTNQTMWERERQDKLHY